MARYVELRRHTDADGDVLTQEGVRGGQDRRASARRLRPTCLHGCAACDADARVSSRRARRAGRGWSRRRGRLARREDRWREAYEKAGSGEKLAYRAEPRPAHFGSSSRSRFRPSMANGSFMSSLARRLTVSAVASPEASGRTSPRRRSVSSNRQVLRTRTPRGLDAATERQARA